MSTKEKVALWLIAMALLVAAFVALIYYREDEALTNYRLEFHSEIPNPINEQP